MSVLERFLAAAGPLQASLLAAGRTSALLLLGEGPIARKRARAREAARRIDQAAALEELLERNFQVRPRHVAWPLALRPDAAKLIADGRVDVEAAQAALDRVSRDAAGLLHSALTAARSSHLLEPAAVALEPIAATFEEVPPLDPADLTWAPPRRSEIPSKPQAPFRGPVQVAIDPVFEPSYTVLDRKSVEACSTHRAPHFWNLALREATAAELCALSIVEQDGLPIAFHRDFAKQAWDETRHAQLFLDAAIELIPEFLAASPADHPFVPAARRFLQTRSGLPVAREKGLYEAIWNCSLEERLVLLHVDTEAPGVAGFQRELRGSFCKTHPAIAERLEIATRDEASHARLGRAWLQHLLPDPVERKARIDEALMMRGVLLLSGIAHHQEKPLHELLGERVLDSRA